MAALPQSGSRVLVVGLGKTGLSCARWLREQGCVVAVTDSRTSPPGLASMRTELPEIPLLLGGFVEAAFDEAELVVVSPGVPLSEPVLQRALAAGKPVIGDVELFARAVRAPVIGITGSNGKSTVTTLLGLMARAAGRRAAIGGNLGDPVLEILAEDVELYVVELSSFQLEATHSLALQAATVLNLSPDHMDRYASLADYGAAKARIFAHAETAVVNRDDRAAAALADGVPRSVGFTLGAPVESADHGILRHRGAPWIARGAEPLMPVSDLLLAGRHNLANALAALSLGTQCGLDREPMHGVLRSFRGLPHRSELVADRNDVRWINDSKGTNPGATVAALEGLVSDPSRGKAVLIAGGTCKGLDFGALADAVERAARVVILIGRDADLVARCIGTRVPVLRAASMDQAVRIAGGAARPGDCVLLSPACASFDMFDDYQDRGRAFVAAVQRWVA